MDEKQLSYEEINQPYYFESDHVTLRDNVDYHNLLHTISLLEVQRQQAANDIETLYNCQEAALVDPMVFVQKQQNGCHSGFPKPQHVAPLPIIRWDKYTSTPNFSSFCLTQHNTRNKKSLLENGGVDKVQNLKSQLTQGIPFPSVPSTTTDSSNFTDNVVVVRGRARDSSKPATFNQLWTEEEQQRLEKLLLQFPPEEVESRRWEKIADALGNRTPIQVASRVQKYFLRLAKEGLPVPGRMPNVNAFPKKNTHRHHRFSRMYFPNSTLMQSHVPPVWMTEDNSDLGVPSTPERTVCDGYDQHTRDISRKDDSSDSDDYPEELFHSSEYQELQRLKELRREKLTHEQSQFTKHIGYKCDACGVEPIIGNRWHCIDCPADVSCDFCDDCSSLPFQEHMHDSSHRLQPLKRDVLDSDYISFAKSNYNYLDPNFMPANK